MESREIKFRAWSEYGMFKTMIEDYCYLSKYNHFHGSDLTNTDYGKIIAVMQYTGLKDKNGKEIYEGDILHFTNGEIRIGNEWKPNIEQLTVKVSAAGLCSNIGWARLVTDSIEVIGNIYEHPNLMPK